MLYGIIKLILQVTIKVFFHSITIKNKEAIPENGPVLFLANHPATFMDPIVMACIIKRKVFFLAKGSLFTGPVISWILARFNLIPIYRKQDDPRLLNKNMDTFKKCNEHLEKGGAIIIYPEGVSIIERKLKPIKSGASHIALSTEEKNGFKLGVKIVNIGLNYENQQKFNKDLYINIHEPILVKSFEERYKKDKVETIRELTHEIDRQLSTLVISVPDEKTDQFLKDIETLYLQQLKEEWGISGKQVPAEFAITQKIIKAINYFSEIDPAFISTIQIRIKNYFRHLHVYRLSDSDIKTFNNNGAVWFSNILRLLFLLFGLPIYLYGLINNYLPFQIPDWIAAKTKDYRGAVAMVSGIVTFTIFYAFQIFWVYEYTQSPIWSILYGMSLPISGFFAFYYWKNFNLVKSKWLLIALFYRRSIVFRLLVEERRSIITQFEKAEKDFIQKFPETE